MGIPRGITVEVHSADIRAHILENGRMDAMVNRGAGKRLQDDGRYSMNRYNCSEIQDC